MNTRLSTQITILSSHFEPYSELENRCLTLADEVRRMEVRLRKMERAEEERQQAHKESFVDIAGARVFLLADEDQVAIHNPPKDPNKL